MVHIITLATSKGGTGKTTLAAGLATYWQNHGLSVGMVDADPNANLTRWFAKGEIHNIPITSESDEGAIIDAVDELAGNHDIVIVDIAGFANQVMVYAIGVSTLVLIPSKPSEDDVLEAIKTKRLVENAARLTRREIPYYVVITQGKQGTHVMTHTRKQFAAFEIPVLKAEIMHRTAFQDARFHGTTPILMEPRSKASQELAVLAKEVNSILTAEQ